MKKFIIAFIVIVIIAAAILILPDLASAQPPPPPGKPTQTPIDGGLGLLATAGGAYAVKKLRDKKK
ncbi:MAG: hypothetical protein GVY07_13845 [Bacteroidetes bacterium]|jgi:hypothetical protein|nr:hypothetical protein [Bacteroidota bacterium]